MQPERTTPTDRFCVECGEPVTVRRRITCSAKCRNARARMQSRDSQRRRYSGRRARRDWLKPMYCATCGVQLEQLPGVRTPTRCAKHRAEHEASQRTAKEKRRRLRRHGLTEETYRALLLAQGEACAICQSHEPTGRGTWHIDHDHRCCEGPWSCGKCVRGLLCGRCNNLIGYADERPEVLLSAAEYVRKRT